jgi:septum formation protein
MLMVNHRSELKHNSKIKIVLASASPRRKALLQQLGIRFTVDRSEVTESMDPAADYRDQAIQLSMRKAAAVAKRHPGSIVIAADTFGVYKGEIIGKPADGDDAEKILNRLNGGVHTVITGVTVINTGTGKTISDYVQTKVFIKKLSREEITSYVNSGEPLDKAGAYAIQGLGAALVERIEGDYSNVVGLPLARLAGMLKEFDINVI